jgi:hypothetical protein
VTITERGEVYNSIFRFLSHFFFSQHASIDQYLMALGKKHREQRRWAGVGGDWRQPGSAAQRKPIAWL